MNRTGQRRIADQALALLEPRIITDYAQLQSFRAIEDAIHGNAQSLSWVECWRKHVNKDSFIAALFAGGQPAMMLPFEVVGSDRLRVARYPGGSHANCNFPWLNFSQTVSVDRAALEKLVAAIRQARPDIDTLSLTRQLPQLAGVDNPLLRLRSRPNPNPVLAASLYSGFETVLERSNAKRKLKKHRQHGRRYEDAGGWRIYSPQTRKEAEQTLDVFFALKAHRFEQMGISDPFAGTDVRAFFKDLFGKDAGRQNAATQLQVLEVGGIIRSLMGKTIAKPGPSVEFSAIANDELVSASPGEFLFYEDIKNSCGTGYEIYNFGIGDEPYKREWCDIETVIYDTIMPLSTTGKIFTVLDSIKTHAVASIKSNPRLWQATKDLRRKFARR